MIEVELSAKDAKRITAIMQRMAGDDIVRAILNATHRAAITARKAGEQEIRKIYVIRAKDLKSRATIRKGALETTIQVKGPFEKVQQYRARKRAKGIFVTIKKGSGSLIPRSFDQGGRFMARTSKKRFPVEGLYGPAVPQIFGNPDVVDAMEEAGMAMYEKRLEHELDRIMKGYGR